MVLQSGHLSGKSFGDSDAAEAIEAEIVELCRSRMAGYKVPRQLVFVGDLPKTTSGKILKRQLISPF